MIISLFFTYFNLLRYFRDNKSEEMSEFFAGHDEIVRFFERAPKKLRRLNASQYIIYECFRKKLIDAKLPTIEFLEREKNLLHLDVIVEKILHLMSQFENHVPEAAKAERLKSGGFANCEPKGNEVTFGDFMRCLSDHVVKQEYSADLEQLIYGTCGELFGDQISWYKIISMLCFATSLAVSVHRKHDELIAAIVFQYTNDHLLSWIFDHGGWIAVIPYWFDH